MSETHNAHPSSCTYPLNPSRVRQPRIRLDSATPTDRIATDLSVLATSLLIVVTDVFLAVANANSIISDIIFDRATPQSASQRAFAKRPSCWWQT